MPLCGRPVRTCTFCPTCGKREARLYRGSEGQNAHCSGCANSMLSAGIRRDRSRVGAVLPPEQRRDSINKSPTVQACPGVEAIEEDAESFSVIVRADSQDLKEHGKDNGRSIEISRKDEQHGINNDARAFSSCTPKPVLIEIPVFTERDNTLAPQCCVRCLNSSSFRMRCGPDGPRTLCHICGVEYAQCRLPLYQRGDGSLTVVHEETFHFVEHHGFEVKPFHRRGRDLSRPIISLSEVATGQLSGMHVEQDATHDEDEEKRTVHDSKSRADRAGYQVVEELTRGQASGTVSGASSPVTAGSTRGKGRTEGQHVQPSFSVPAVGRLISKNSHKSSSALIYVKAALSSKGKICIRRFPISYGMSFDALQNEMRKRFETKKIFKIMYEDNKGDLVRVSADGGVEELYRLTRRYKISPLRLRLRVSDSDI